jgi:putative endonuclease
MYFIYIIYSESTNLYYVGYTNDPNRRLFEHNTNPHNTFTSKHRPWLMKALFECGILESQALIIERFIKKQKSRKLIELLCNPSFIPVGKLTLLVRVPHVRDPAEGANTYRGFSGA